jgi:hypothetical protein
LFIIAFILHVPTHYVTVSVLQGTGKVNLHTATILKFMGADYMGAVGPEHLLNDFRSAEQPLYFPYRQFIFEDVPP